MVEQAENAPYTCSSTISIVGDELETERFRELEAAERHDEATGGMLRALADAVRAGERLIVRLADTFPKEVRTEIAGPAGGRCAVDVVVRRLGEDTGRDVVLHLGDQIIQTAEHTLNVQRHGV